MRPARILLPAAIVALRLNSLAQGTFFYDQQSSDESAPGEAATSIQAFQPMGQSFTPALPSVGFVRLELYDGNPGNGLGGTVYLNLRSDSITGPILATSAPVSLPDGLGSPPGGWFTDFYFKGNIGVNPGTMYYLQPVVQFGDNMLAGNFIPTHDYLGGSIVLNGVPNPNADLWFREGMVIPEPTSCLLFLLAAVVYSCGKHINRPPLRVQRY